MGRYKITITYTDNPNHQDPISWTDGVDTWFMRYYDSVSAPGIDPDTNPTQIQSPWQATPSRSKSDWDFFWNSGVNSGKWLTANITSGWTVEGEFANDGLGDPKPPVINGTPANTTFLIEQTTEPLSILSYAFSTNVAQPCNLIDVTITASKVFDEILQPVQATFADTLTYTVVGMQRQFLGQFLIKDSDDQTAAGSKWTPDFLDPNLIQVEVVNNTVVVNSAFVGLNPLEYSLDDVNWQILNTFNGLTAGDYTIYTRDPYGCKVSTPITIEEGTDGVITIPDPYFHYSDSNPVRIARRVEWDGCNENKNDHNTLSCESTDNVVFIEKQKWRSCDVITMQIKNNYSDLEVVTSDDPLTPLVWTQKSNNLNNKVAMDCKIVKLSDTTNGIYFLIGNTYDYDTLTDLNEPYALTGELPGWAHVGQVVTINNFNYTITAISFNEDLQVNQFVINAVLSAGDNIVKAIYNIQDYEIYETSVVLAGKTEPFNFQFSYAGEFQWASEIQIIDDISTKLYKVQYSMTYNTDMFWATGITPYIRLQVDRDNAVTDRDSEGFETDTTSYQIDVSNYRVNKLILLPVTKELARKCATIFSCDNVNINGVDYKTEGFDWDSQEESNLYVINATMKEKGTGLGRDKVGTFTVTLPSLINTGNGYIKI